MSYEIVQRRYRRKKWYPRLSNFKRAVLVIHDLTSQYMELLLENRALRDVATAVKDGNLARAQMKLEVLEQKIAWRSYNTLKTKQYSPEFRAMVIRYAETAGPSQQAAVARYFGISAPTLSKWRAAGPPEDMRPTFQRLEKPQVPIVVNKKRVEEESGPLEEKYSQAWKGTQNRSKMMESVLGFVPKRGEPIPSEKRATNVPIADTFRQAKAVEDQIGEETSEVDTDWDDFF